MRTTLLSLPPELLHITASHLALPSISALTRSCKSLHTQLLPHLHRLAARRLSPSGESHLHTAATTSNLPLLSLLLPYAPAGAHSRTRSGLTPLHLAAREGHVAALRFLLDADPRADVDCATKRGVTPLLCAVWERKGAAVAELLARGARVGVRDWAGLGVWSFLGGRGGGVRVLVEREWRRVYGSVYGLGEEEEEGGLVGVEGGWSRFSSVREPAGAVGW
ncbi:ankyrin repeat-containing domain protein [Geopyxis carbonaria]|nr:ankyrin repeat-containing domain protein [Geopyxis carbonaria]